LIKAKNSRCCLLLIDWENIWISLERVYGVTIAPQECLRKIVAKAREYGPTETRVFYSDRFRLRGSLSRAIRECEATGREISALSDRPEKNLADSDLITDALVTFFTANPRHELFIIASGDNAFTSVLRAIRERAGPDAARIAGLNRTMAEIIKDAPLVSHGLISLDEVLDVTATTGSTLVGPTPKISSFRQRPPDKLTEKPYEKLSPTIPHTSGVQFSIGPVHPGQQQRYTPDQLSVDTESTKAKIVHNLKSPPEITKLYMPCGGSISEWRRKDGDLVANGEIICIITKGNPPTFEQIEAPVRGILRVLAPERKFVLYHDILGWIIRAS
jgi:NYN domain